MIQKIDAASLRRAVKKPVSILATLKSQPSPKFIISSSPNNLDFAPQGGRNLHLHREASFPPHVRVMWRTCVLARLPPN